MTKKQIILGAFNSFGSEDGGKPKPVSVPELAAYILVKGLYPQEDLDRVIFEKICHDCRRVLSEFDSTGTVPNSLIHSVEFERDEEGNLVEVVRHIQTEISEVADMERTIKHRGRQIGQDFKAYRKYVHFAISKWPKMEEHWRSIATLELDFGD